MNANSSLVSSAQNLANGVAAMANSAALVSSLHEAMLAEVRGVLEQNALLQSELAEQKARAEQVEAKLKDAEAALARVTAEKPAVLEGEVMDY